MSVGTPELLICAAIALIVLGPERIPQAARMAGRAMRELRSVSSDLSSQVKDFVEEPPSATPSDAQSGSESLGDQPKERTQTPPDLSQFTVIPDSRTTSSQTDSSQTPEVERKDG